MSRLAINKSVNLIQGRTLNSRLFKWLTFNARREITRALSILRGMHVYSRGRHV